LSRWDAERVEREAAPPADIKDLKSLAALALLYTETGMKNERFGLPVRPVDLAPREKLDRLEEWRKLPWPRGNKEQQKDLLLGTAANHRGITSLADFDVYSRTALQLIREIVREARRQNDTTLLDFCINWYIAAGSFVSPFHGTTGYMPIRRAALVDFGERPEILLLVGSYTSEAHSKEIILRHVLALDPLLVEARVRLGDFLRVLGRWDEAKRELEFAVRDAHAAGNVPMEYLALLVLGRVLEEVRGPKEAESAYKAAAALNPRWEAARMALASVGIRVGDVEQGWADAQAALELGMSPRSDPDPWNIRHRAQFWQLRSRITSMRAAVRR